jgi:serpin B
VQLLELPYRGHELGMVVLLPEAQDGLPALERQLSAPTVARWLEALEPTAVDVTLPRFTCTAGADLKQVLQALGMRRACTPQADFSGISGTPLMIGAVLHKAFVAVDEQGTEAAAATMVGIFLGAALEPPEPVPFVADHPFVWLIRHRPTGTILFVGRVCDPSD